MLQLARADIADHSQPSGLLVEDRESAVAVHPDKLISKLLDAVEVIKSDNIGIPVGLIAKQMN